MTSKKEQLIKEENVYHIALLNDLRGIRDMEIDKIKLQFDADFKRIEKERVNNIRKINESNL